MPAVTSLIVGSIALGASVYSANEQKKAQRKASNMQEQQALEARKIAAEQKPMEESATLQTDMGGGVLGNLGLSVEPLQKKPSLGGTTTQVGLGFGV